MRVQRIESIEELSAIAPDWDRLVVRSGYELPFSTFAWCASWWRHLARSRWAVRDRLSVRAVWDSQGELAAVAPFMVTERPGVGPVRVRLLRFLGADPGITELPGIVCLPEFERQACSALLENLRAGNDEWHWIRWSGLKPGGIATDVIGSHRPLLRSRNVPMYVLTLAPSWQAFHRKLPRNIKESLRKCYNSLKRDGHTFVFTATERAEEMPAALHEFFRLHRARADAPCAVPHADAFATEGARGFLIETCEAFSRQGATRVFTMTIGDRIVAMRIGFVLGGSLYLYYSGFDPAWSKYSVMTTVVAEAIKYAIAAGLQTVNLSVGNDVSKTRWRPTAVSYCEAIQISPSFGAHAAHAVYRSAKKARFALGAAPRRGALS